MIMLDLAVFLFALSVAAAIPGPGLAAIVATVLSDGARRAAWFGFGVAVGDLVWLSLSIGGLALIAQQFQIIFIAVKWIGVAYLLYLASKIWFSPKSDPIMMRRSIGKYDYTQVLAGFLVTMGNPKAMLFYIALLPRIIALDQVSVKLYVALSLGVLMVLAMVLAMVFSAYILMASKARLVLLSTRSRKIFNRASATGLGGAAIWIAAR